MKLRGNSSMDVLSNGKQSIAINLKHKKGVDVMHKLCKTADVLIEPFRKGVMESLGLGPDIVLKNNERLIYARLTGYGQKGAFSNMAGHDINYLSLSGLLSLFGRTGEKPIFPVNLAADFGGGGLMCALGILLALFERNQSNKGQVVDCDMVSGTAYLGSWLYRSQKLPIWGNERGNNVLDTGAHFYEVYKTKDEKFVSVGAFEFQFYEELLKGLNLSVEDVPHFTDFEENKELFSSIFAKKTQEEWCNIFDGTNACVTPVLTIDEAPQHKHNQAQNTFVKNVSDEFVPATAPKLSRTSGESKSIMKVPEIGEHTEVIMRSLQYTKNEILELENENVIHTHKASKL